MAIDNHKKSFVINLLRRGTYRWPGRWIAEKRAKLTARGEYYCEKCGLVCKKKDTQMDHEPPVIPVSGWDSWENVIDRMFCSPTNFQRLCLSCHADKTKAEGSVRTTNRRKKKI